MRDLPFKACFSLLLAFLIVSCADSDEEAREAYASKQLLSQAELGDFSHGIALGDLRFRFLWRLREDSIDIKLQAPTNGWVAVGFNPETGENMKGANLLIGFVTAGKAEVVDHYGTMKDKHKYDDRIGGQTDVSNVSGFEAGGTTEVQFTIPLDSGDAKDRPLSLEDDNTVLLAYGNSDRIVLKHKFRAILRLNLSTGAHRVVKMK
jgi:hypothetical protein